MGVANCLIDQWKESCLKMVIFAEMIGDVSGVEITRFIFKNYFVQLVNT